MSFIITLNDNDIQNILSKNFGITNEQIQVQNDTFKEKEYKIGFQPPEANNERS